MDSSKRKSLYNEALSTSHFRILYLKGGQPDEKIRCRLKTFELTSDLPAYEAISYVCGISAEEIEIECDGVLTFIRPSLHRALQSFRFDNADRLLWADQVCINQGSDQERSAQVSIMGAIFANARQVLMWLHSGTEYHHTLLQQLVPSILSAVDNGIKFEFPQPPTDQELEMAGLPDSKSEKWKALETFALDPYFTRVWVVQEVAFARQAQLFWGSFTARWSDLVTCLSWIVADIGTIAGFTSALSTTHLLRFSENESLFGLLQKTYSLAASDKRDKIFALLGLVQTSVSDNNVYKVDYTKDLAQVRYEVTRYMIEEAQNLDVLSNVQHTATEVPTYGSWGITFFDRKDEKHTVPAFPFWRQGTEGFHASRMCQISLRRSFDPSSLSVEGVRIASVECSIKTLSDVNDTQALYESWRLCRSLAAATNLQELVRQFVWTLTAGRSLDGRYAYPSMKVAGDELLLDFCKYCISPLLRDVVDDGAQLIYETGFELLGLAMHAYRRSDTAKHHASKSLSAESQLWLERRLELFYQKSDARYDEALQTWKSVIESPVAYAQQGFNLAFAAAGISRALIALQSGKLALAPAATQKNDIIVVLFAGTTPFVLRPTDVSGKYFFVGECYVEEFMNGQAIDMIDAGELLPEWFTLQ